MNILLALLFLLGTTLSAQIDRNLLPKYGLLPKEDRQKQADAVFISGMDEEYHGDRRKAASEMALRCWQYLQSGNQDGAMRRFNQAWLLDSKSGVALWGMAAIEADAGKLEDSLKLFKEAEARTGDNLNFQLDYARVVGIAGLASKDDRLIKDACKRFQRVYEREPQNVRNLQNWAKTLYGAGNYTDAWSKVQLAEATPDRNQLDSTFLADLEGRMARPSRK